MNYDAVHELHRTRSAARPLFQALLERGAVEGRTTVEEIIDDGSVSRRQAISLLRELAEAGCGEFKVGRKGHPSRLEWSVDPRELAARVQGDDDDPDDDDAAASDDPPLQGALALDGAPPPSANEPPPASSSTELIEHVHVLRPDLRVVVRLPADLTRLEAGVLGDWIRNLSFER
jgi:hypothetical protein